MSLDDMVSLFITPTKPMTDQTSLFPTEPTVKLTLTVEDIEKYIFDLFRQLPLDRAVSLLDQLDEMLDEAKAG